LIDAESSGFPAAPPSCLDECALERIDPFARFRTFIVAMGILEETRGVETIPVSFMSPQQPANSLAIRRNPAETTRVENTTKIGMSVEKRSDSIDRRVSVAPMMDWTDTL
jgi:hypothetical protein